jgi:hypothetical protein
VIFRSNPAKFVGDLREVDGSFWVFRLHPPIKIDRQEIIDILLKEELNTITLAFIVRVVDITGLVTHHCLNFAFINNILHKIDVMAV